MPSVPALPHPVLAGVRDPRAPDHICLRHASREEELAAAISFVRTGLDRRAQCLCIADEGARSPLLAALEADGVAIAAAQGAGALGVVGPDAARLIGSRFERESRAIGSAPGRRAIP